MGGAIAQKPACAGHAWQFLQYLLGFQRLGYEVLFLDRLRMPGPQEDIGLRWLERVMADEGLERSWTLDLGDRTAGVDRRSVMQFVADADVLINVMGFITDEEIMATAKRRIFLDTDPGFGQMWCALGLADVFAGHDVQSRLVSGSAGPAARCQISACHGSEPRSPWCSTAGRHARPGAACRFTSVASLRGSYAAVQFAGRRYGLRVHELRRFAELPAAPAPGPSSSSRWTWLRPTAPMRCGFGTEAGGWLSRTAWHPHPPPTVATSRARTQR